MEVYQREGFKMSFYKTIIIVFFTIIITNVIWAENKTFIIGVEDLDYYPLYTVENGKYSGYSREVLDKFSHEKGYSFIYKPYPVSRLFYLFLDKQQIDFKYPDNNYWQKEKKEGKRVYYSFPVVNYIDGVIVLPEKKGMGLDKLKVLGTIRGFTAWEYLEPINKGLILQEFSNVWSGLIKKALIKRIDGAYCNITVAAYQLREKIGKPNALVFDPDLPHTKSSYLMSTIKYPKILNQFSEWLKNNDSLIMQIKSKYKAEEY